MKSSSLKRTLVGCWSGDSEFSPSTLVGADMDAVRQGATRVWGQRAKLLSRRKPHRFNLSSHPLCDPRWVHLW
jgi:hypothetical protein